MKYTRFVSLLAVSALLAASLAGCGSSASSVASSASSEAVSSVAESAVSEAASESAAASSALWNRDSNPNKQSQSLSCYRYTIPQDVIATELATI